MSRFPTSAAHGHVAVLTRFRVSPPDVLLLLQTVAVALAVRFLVVALVYKGFLEPGREHWEFGYEMGSIARSIVSGHGFANPFWVPTGPTAVITPVFPYLLAGIFAVFGVQTTSAALVALGLNSVFSALTCVPIFYIAKRTLDDRSAKWAAWSWAFFPYAIHFSADSMWCHSFGALLVTLLFWLTLELGESDRKVLWAGFGLLAAVTSLTQPVALSVMPFLLGWAAWRLRREGKQWAAAVATAILALGATIAPWMIRNYETFHRPVFIKDDFWLEVSVGNLGNAEHWWSSDVQPSGSAENLQEFQRLGELGYMEQKRDEILRYIRSNPGVFVGRCVRRIVFMWTGFWSFRMDYLKQEPLDPLNIILCAPVTILALIGLRGLLRKQRDIALLYLLLPLIFPVSYYVTHPDFAYRQPIDPVVVILACTGVFSLVEAYHKRHALMAAELLPVEVYDQRIS